MLLIPDTIFVCRINITSLHLLATNGNNNLYIKKKLRDFILL